MIKVLIFILSFLSAINCYAQNDSIEVLIISEMLLEPQKSQDYEVHLYRDIQKQKTLNNIKIIGLYAASIVMNGIGDGLNNSNRKTIGHILNAISIGILLSSPFILDFDRTKWYWYLASYISLRVGLFDSTYNLTRELPLFSTGSTSPSDKLYNIFGINPAFPRPIFLAVGITIPFWKL